MQTRHKIFFLAKDIRFILHYETNIMNFAKPCRELYGIIVSTLSKRLNRNYYSRNC